MPSSSFPEDSFILALHAGLPSALARFLVQQRWFGGKARTIRSIEISDIIPFFSDGFRAYFVLAQVEYAGGSAETYQIPFVRTSDLPSHLNTSSVLRIPPAKPPEEAIVLKEALTDENFLTRLLDAVAKGMSLRGARGQVRAVSTPSLLPVWQPSQGALTPSVMHAEQSNSSVVYEKRLVLKIYRRVEEGLNPDLEIGSFLTSKTAFRSVPPMAGYLKYVDDKRTGTALGMLQGYVSNQGDAWQLTLKALAGYYATARESGSPGGASTIPPVSLLDLSGHAVPDEAKRRIGPYLESAALLGRRTAELHLALASVPEDPEFAPQPFSEKDRQAFANSAVQLLTANFDLLRSLKNEVPDHTWPEAEKVLKLEEVAHRRFQSLLGMNTSAMITRIHGDYHLGQVLFTGSDFVIIDFEGEPARPLEERRRKRSPLQDVAGMLRSFHYAAYAPLFENETRGSAQELVTLGSWAQYWQKWVSATFLKTYLEVSGNSIVLPKGREELALLLELYLLDKAVYELGYELNNRPAWVRIPLDGISQLLKEPV